MYYLVDTVVEVLAVKLVATYNLDIGHNILEGSLVVE